MNPQHEGAATAMTADYKLPGPDAGVAGLLELADRLGPASAFTLIRTCRTAQGAGADPGGDTLTILARRIVAAETLKAGGDGDAGRKAAATKLGYGDTTRTNFYHRVLGRENVGKGDPELLRLARVHGSEAVFNLIRLARTARSVQQDAGRQALTELAQRLVRVEMETAAVDELTARQRVADRLGYTAKRDGNSRSNFTKIYNGGRAPEARPRGDRRSKGNR